MREQLVAAGFRPWPLPCHTYSNGDRFPLPRCSIKRSTNFFISENIHTDDVSDVRNTISATTTSHLTIQFLGILFEKFTPRC